MSGRLAVELMISILLGFAFLLLDRAHIAESFSRDPLGMSVLLALAFSLGCLTSTALAALRRRKRAKSIDEGVREWNDGFGR